MWAEPDFCLLHNYRPETFTTACLRQVLPALTSGAWADIKSALARQAEPDVAAAATTNRAMPANALTNLIAAADCSLEASPGTRTPQGEDSGSPSSAYRLPSTGVDMFVDDSNVTPAASVQPTNPLHETFDHQLTSLPRTPSPELLVELSEDNDAAVVVRIASHVQLGQPMPCQVEVELASEHDRDELRQICPEVERAEQVYILSHVAYASMSGVISCHANGLVFNGNSSFLQLVLGRQLADITDRSVEILLPEFYQQADVLCKGSPLPSPFVLWPSLLVSSRHCLPQSRQSPPRSRASLTLSIWP